jgi:hypothetical protein
MPDLIRLEGIETLSAPSEREDLLRARHAIHASVELQKIFERAETQQWGTERLASELAERLAAHGTVIDPSICRYLADEFAARDKGATLLVSAETGLAVAQVPEDAIYVPALVAREGTDELAVPLPRLKPEIEAAIIQHRNTVAEEPLVIAKLQDRARSTELLRAEGDRRLQISTRSGRKKLSDRLQDELPEILADHRGAVGRLFERCRVNETPPKECEIRIPLTLRGHSSILVVDSLAMNFRYDVSRAAREKIRFGWAVRLARELSTIAHRTKNPRLVTSGEALPSGLLIGTPDLAAAGYPEVLPLIDQHAVVVAGLVYLEVQDECFDFEAYETEARWCVDASVTLNLCLSARSLHPLVFKDLSESGLVVEVV